jgi:hypothetical protein
MTQSDQGVVPKVDDTYWFSLSEDLVTKSLGIHEAAAARIQTLVLWLWGIYTAATGVGVGLAGRALPLWALLIIAAASAVLIAVYWATTWVQAPVEVEFDPRSPDEIMDAFGRIVQVRRRRFRITMAGSVTAAAFVVVAIMIASTVHEEANMPQQLSGVILKMEKGQELAIRAYVGKQSEVRVHVTPMVAARPSVSIERAVLANDSGLMQTSVSLGDEVTSAIIQVDWKGRENTTWSMSRVANRG